MPTNIFLPIGVHNARLTEDYAHKSIHDGNIYRVRQLSTIGAASSFSLMLTTGVGEAHLMVGLNTDGPGQGNFYENTVASGGTAITPVNANRNVSAVSLMTTVLDPTVSTVGSALGVSIVGSTGFKSATGGSVTSEMWLLEPSSNYLLRFTADAASCRTVLKAVFSNNAS